MVQLQTGSLTNRRDNVAESASQQNGLSLYQFYKNSIPIILGWDANTHQGKNMHYFTIMVGVTVIPVNVSLWSFGY